MLNRDATYATKRNVVYDKSVKERPRDPRGSLTKSVRQFVARDDICGKHFAAVTAFTRAIYKHEKIRMRRLVGRGSFEMKTEKTARMWLYLLEIDVPRSRSPSSGH